MTDTTTTTTTGVGQQTGKPFPWVVSDFGLVDAIEVHNSKTSLQSLNAKAKQYAAHRDIAMGSGSDAHVPHALGSAYVEMPDFDGPAEFLANLRVARPVGRLGMGVGGLGEGEAHLLAARACRIGAPLAELAEERGLHAPHARRGGRRCRRRGTAPVEYSPATVSGRLHAPTLRATEESRGKALSSCCSERVSSCACLFVLVLHALN